MHPWLNIFPIYTNELWNNPARLCEELRSIILMVTEHGQIEIYSVVISDYYSLVVSAPEMIGFKLVLKSNIVHIFKSLPIYNFLS